MFDRRTNIHVVPDFYLDKKETKPDKNFPVRICPDCGRKFDKSALLQKGDIRNYYLDQNFPTFKPEKELCKRCKDERNN